MKPTASPPTDDLRAVLDAAERFAAAIESRAIALMLKLDLSMTQLRAMTAIKRMGRANGRQLAATLGLTPGAVVATCDHLEERGYVRRVADTNDRRVTWFELTDVGSAALKAPPTVALARSRIKTVVAELTPAERDGFVKIAAAFADAVESVIGSAVPTRAEGASRRRAGSRAGRRMA